MYSKEGLQKGFERAGLHLEFEKETRFNKDIFACRVTRDLKGVYRHEYFVMQPGHETNTIMVLDSNKEFGQVLILVKEEARTWKEKERIHWRSRKTRWVERKASAARRKFLLGMDERQLFMCQVNPTATTVKQAHDLLKSPTVYTAEGKVGRATRQGEWFFVKTTDVERKVIEDGLKNLTVILRKKARIGNRGGKPHMADELINMPGPRLEHGFAVRGNEQYIRGKVRHPDHKTVEFKQWVKVFRNTETREGVRNGMGGTWID